MPVQVLINPTAAPFTSTPGHRSPPGPTRSWSRRSAGRPRPSPGRSRPSPSTLYPSTTWLNANGSPSSWRSASSGPPAGSPTSTRSPTSRCSPSARSPQLAVSDDQLRRPRPRRRCAGQLRRWSPASSRARARRATVTVTQTVPDRGQPRSAPTAPAGPASSPSGRTISCTTSASSVRRRHHPPHDHRGGGRHGPGRHVVAGPERVAHERDRHRRDGRLEQHDHGGHEPRRAQRAGRVPDHRLDRRREHGHADAGERDHRHRGRGRHDGGDRRRHRRHPAALRQRRARRLLHPQRDQRPGHHARAGERRPGLPQPRHARRGERGRLRLRRAARDGGHADRDRGRDQRGAQLDGPGGQRQPDHRLHRHPLPRRDGADPEVGLRLDDHADLHRADRRRLLHLHRGRHQRRGHLDPEQPVHRRRALHPSRRPDDRDRGRGWTWP